MIRSFRTRETENLFNDEEVLRFGNLNRKIGKKLAQINAARELRDLYLPPSNRLEKLHGDREGQRSIRVNDQWRICFVWKEGDAYNVEIADYH